MFPVYGGMSSYPYQASQMPPTHYYHPSWEAPSLQMKEGPASSARVHESWPHSYGCLAPMPCHNGCAHGQFPACYNFRPPCHHIPPPTCNHYYGGYPAYPQPYPVNYVPPPHYTMDMPKYEYDKSVPKEFHCCECPNHPRHAKSKTNVKIEEHKPDVEDAKVKSLVPTGVNSIPYPFLWMPPGYKMNIEHPLGVVKSEAGEQQVSPYVSKPQMNPRSVQTEVGGSHGSQPVKESDAAGQDPNVTYGWFPLDMNSIRELLEGGYARKTHDHENKCGDKKKAHDVEKKDNTKQIPHPVIQLPSGGHIEKKLADKMGEEGKTPAAEPPSSFKVVPVKLEHPDNQAKERTLAGDHATGDGTRKIEKCWRTIPVKQLEESAPKLSKKDEKIKEDVTLQGNLEKGNQEPVKSRSNTQSSVPTKKSKLPPICLRVDPPKKKNGNGSSRSPSPPGDKNRQVTDDSNAEGRKEVRATKDCKEMDVMEHKSNEKKIEVSHDAREDKEKSGAHERITGADKIVKEEAGKSFDAKSGDDKVLAPECREVKEVKSSKSSRPLRKTMSEIEAAIAIQSAYRGYELRRWDPLKKLRQIAEVRKEATEVKNQIEDLQSHAILDDKKKTVIAETIMNLLLKLDTIQGLHASIRDVRRFVARELTLLQEKLDFTMSPKPIDPVEGPIAEIVQKPPKVSELEGSAGSVESIGEAFEVCGLDEAISADKCSEPQRGDGRAESISQSGNQDAVCGPTDKGISEILQVNEEPHSEVHNGVVSAMGSNVDLEGADSCPEMKKKEIDSNETLTTERLEQLVNAIPVGDTVVVSNTMLGNQDQEADLPAELPQQVVEEQMENEISRMDWECDLGSAKITDNKDHEWECDMGKSKTTGNQDQGLNLLAKLPHEVVEEQVETEISRMDWECDLGIVKSASLGKEPDQQHQGSVSQMEKDNSLVDSPQELINRKEEQTCEVERSGTLIRDQQMNQPSETTSEVASADLVGIEHEYDVPVAVVSDDSLSCQSSECTDKPKGLEVPIMGQEDGELQKPTGGEPCAVELGLQEKVVEVPSQEGHNEVINGGLEMSCSISNLVSELPDNSASNGERFCKSFGEDYEKAEEADESPRNLEITPPFDVTERPDGSKAVKQEVKAGTENLETAAQACEEEGEASTLSSESQGSGAAYDNAEQLDKKIAEDNERLREMLDKLLATGKEQQEVISNLTGKVKDLENQLAKKKKVKSTKQPRVIVSRPSCKKSPNGRFGARPMGVAS